MTEVSFTALIVAVALLGGIAGFALALDIGRRSTRDAMRYADLCRRETEAYRDAIRSGELRWVK